MDNNKLIAEFMEVPTEVFKSGIMNYYPDRDWETIYLLII